MHVDHRTCSRNNLVLDTIALSTGACLQGSFHRISFLSIVGPSLLHSIQAFIRRYVGPFQSGSQSAYIILILFLAITARQCQDCSLPMTRLIASLGESVGAVIWLQWHERLSYHEIVPLRPCTEISLTYWYQVFTVTCSCNSSLNQELKQISSTSSVRPMLGLTVRTDDLRSCCYMLANDHSSGASLSNAMDCTTQAGQEGNLT